MESVRAKFFVEVSSQCPYCDALDEILSNVSEVMNNDHRASNIDVEITCSECKNIYIVTDIDY